MADYALIEQWLDVLNQELDARRPMIDRLDAYKAGCPEPPEHIREIRLDTEYRVLMRQAVTNWPDLIVSSRMGRLEIVGFDFGDETVDEEVWSIWQKNYLDSDSDLVHEGALVDGRSYVIVWADENGEPEIVPEHAANVVVAYQVPSLRKRAAALRRWQGEEDKRWYCTLYLPEAIYKFEAKKAGGLPSNVDWVPRETLGEVWPLPNPLGDVPVVEFAVNRSLSPYRSLLGSFGIPDRCSRLFGTNAYGCFEQVLPIIDRINTTVFAGLLAQAYASFPIRALIGDPIAYAKDENGQIILDIDGKPTPLPPFKAAVNRLVQIENPDGKLVQLPESSLDNYIKFAEMHIRHLAAITNTPAHYLLGEMINLSADAIRAAEASLVAEVTGSLWSDFGEPWEEVMRMALKISNPQVGDEAFESAETKWKDAENRSQAEKADAAVKLQNIVPWQALVETILGATPQEVSRWEAMKASDGLSNFLTSTQTTVPMNGSVTPPTGNGGSQP